MSSLDDYFQSFLTEIKRVQAQVEDLKQQMRSSQQPEKLSYSLPEAAEAIGISKESLYTKCRSGLIHYSQDGAKGSITILRRDLEKYLFAINTGQPQLETPVLKLNGRAGKIVRKYRRNHA